MKCDVVNDVFILPLLMVSFFLIFFYGIQSIFLTFCTYLTILVLEDKVTYLIWGIKGFFLFFLDLRYVTAFESTASSNNLHLLKKKPHILKNSILGVMQRQYANNHQEGSGLQPWNVILFVAVIDLVYQYIS